MQKTMLSFSVLAAALLISSFMWIKNVDQPAAPEHTHPFGSRPVTKPTLDPALKALPKMEQRRIHSEARARWEYDFLKDPATGRLPPNAATIPKAVLRANPRAKNAPQRIESIVKRGPGNLGGRTRAVAFDRADTAGQTMLAGGVSSGLFRSENRGLDWVKVSAQDEIHSVTALAQDPRRPHIWYYGTGELSGNSASAVGAYYHGDGVWRSEDGGRSWSPIAGTRGDNPETVDPLDFISTLAVHPVTSDLYISSPYGIYRIRPNQNEPEQVLTAATPGLWATDMHDVLIRPDGGALYAVINPVNGNQKRIYRSISGDLTTWEPIAMPATWPALTGRTVLALDSTNNLLYALVINNHFNDCESGDAGEIKPEAGLFRLDIASGTWTDLTGNLPNTGDCLTGYIAFSSYGGYNLSLDIDPNNPNRIFLGGINLWVSEDGFRSNTATRNIGGYNFGADPQHTGHHPDLHTVTFDPVNPDIIISGSDGGVHAGNLNTHPIVWENLNNNYITFQYYHVALSPRAADPRAIGGTQDNGTSAVLDGTEHITLFGGDGVSVGLSDYQEVDGQEIINAYLGFQNGNIFRVNSLEETYILPEQATGSIFITYFHLDPDNTEHLYYAALNRLFVTNQASTVDQDSWREMTTLSEAVGPSFNIRSMATTRGPYTPESLLFVGTHFGQLFRVTDPANPEGPAAVEKITLPKQGAMISSIALNPNNHNEALVTLSNYNSPSVYYSNNAAAATPTWTLIEGNIAELSFRASAIVNDREGTLYLVGTNAGLWSARTLNGENTQWQRESVALVGSAVVSQLALRPIDNTLLIGTHGNGMLQATFTTETPRFSEQTYQYQLADIRSGDGATTSVGIVNSSDADVAVEIFAFTEDGQTLGRSSTVTQLPAKASSFLPVADLFPDHRGRIAWLQVTGNNPLSVFAETRSDSTRAAYLASVADQRVYLPHIARDTTNFETVLKVANPTPNPTDISVTGFPGNQTATIEGAAAAFGFSAQVVTEPFGNDLTQTAWAELNAADTGIAAMESFTRLPGRTQSAALGLDQTTGTTLNFLHVATDTNQFWTGMVYINLGEAATEVGETYYNAAGAVLKTNTRLLSPAEKVTLLFDFEHQDEMPAGTAWVQVTATQPLIGYALFGAPSISNNDYFTGLQGNYSGSQRWSYPYFNSSAETFTGLVAVNLGDTAANLTFNAYDRSGNLLESRTIEAVTAKRKYVTTLAGLFQKADTLGNGAWVEAIADGSEWAGFLLWGDQGAASRQHLAGIKATQLPE